jgi:hypothetical protein
VKQGSRVCRRVYVYSSYAPSLLPPSWWLPCWRSGAWVARAQPSQPHLVLSGMRPFPSICHANAIPLPRPYPLLCPSTREAFHLFSRHRRPPPPPPTDICYPRRRCGSPPSHKDTPRVWQRTARPPPPLPVSPARRPPLREPYRRLRRRLSTSSTRLPSCALCSRPE